MDELIATAGRIVETAQGAVRGIERAGTERFLGLPFAAPPVGPLRFRGPRPAPAWTGVRNADSPGAVAMQDTRRVDILLGRHDAPMSEDCLSLNLWRPAEAASNLPVMVFFHGGGFTAGCASHPAYDGARLAARGGLIVIAAQYRLGVLGLLAHPGLEDPDTGLAGNWALQDMIAALEWVRENAAAFGGDPETVTIFGESAGGGAVAALSVCPRARPLFRRAIVQSSSPLPASAETHHEAAEAFFRVAGVAPDLAALQTLPAADLVRHQAQWANTFTRLRTAPRPLVDGDLLPDWPDAGIDAGLCDGLDILVSTNRDEWSFTTLVMPPEERPTDEATVKAQIANLGEAANRLYRAYAEARAARGEASDPYSLWTALRTDQLIRVPALEFLARHAARGKAAGAAWAACITWESGWQAAENGGLALGACHIIELPLLFGTYGDTAHLARLSGGPGVAEVSARLQDAWIAFARTGDPNAPGLPPWPRYAPETRPTMMLGRRCDVVADPRGSERKAMKAALDAPG